MSAFSALFIDFAKETERSRVMVTSFVVERGGRRGGGVKNKDSTLGLPSKDEYSVSRDVRHSSFTARI